MNNNHINKDDMLTIDDKFVRMTTYSIKKAILNILHYITKEKLTINI